MKWKFIIVMVVALVLSGCSKGKPDTNNDLGSGDKSNLPVSLTSLIEHAEYCKAITIVVVIKKMKLRLR